MRVQPVSSGVATGGGDLFIPAYCFVTDLVGDFVYIMGDKVGGTYQVSKADIDDVSKMPSVGVIVSKSSASDAVVQVLGLIRGLYSGLTPQKRYFLGADSRPSATYTRPTTGFRLVQVVGIAVASDELLLGFEKPTVVLPT
jgi:hypothetical protein